jgi:hypothetical protein
VCTTYGVGELNAINAIAGSAAGKVFEFVNLRISAALCLALAIFVAADAVMLQASWLRPWPVAQLGEALERLMDVCQ